MKLIIWDRNLNKVSQLTDKLTRILVINQIFLKMKCNKTFQNQHLKKFQGQFIIQLIKFSNMIKIHFEKVFLLFLQSILYISLKIHMTLDHSFVDQHLPWCKWEVKNSIFQSEYGFNLLDLKKSITYLLLHPLDVKDAKHM